jgi:threonine/homoserine/homoserine lactone efflux protein
MMNNPDSGLTSGLLLGISAGISPGPLTLLVMTQTVRHGIIEGAKTAAAPLITDLPIFAISCWLYSASTKLDSALACISFLGSAALLKMAHENWNSALPETTAHSTQKPKSLANGIIANALNPHPYLFWTTIGVPILFRSGWPGHSRVICFISAVFSGLIVAKLATAIIAHYASKANSALIFRTVVRASTFGLIAFATALFLDGTRATGWFK